MVGPQTWRLLDEARWSLGDRVLYHAVGHLLIGDDIAALQQRLLDMGFDSGRADGIFGAQTDRALRDFQRNVGLADDGVCGPTTFKALNRLNRTVTGGTPQALREAEVIRRAGPTLVGKIVVIDPGHGGLDTGQVRWWPDRGVGRLRPRRTDRGTARSARRHRLPHAADWWPRTRTLPTRRRGPTSRTPRAPISCSPSTPTARATLARAASRRTSTAPGAGSRTRPSGRRSPGWSSARSSRAPTCSTAAPTARPGTCSGARGWPRSASSSAT